MSIHQWLALETSTSTLSLAVAKEAQTWTHTSPGGALTSTHMIPQILALLKQADLALTDLQAVVFGRGPGAFTGLRTACSVAQGLALGAHLPVLPIDTLLAVAEEARLTHTTPTTPTTRVLAVMDARMDQVYVAAYEYIAASGDAGGHAPSPIHAAPGSWHCVQGPELQTPETLRWPAEWASSRSAEANTATPSENPGHAPTFIAAGNAWPVYAGRWPAALRAPQIAALPTAAALLRLAPQLWAQGAAVPPEEALPLYIRDKVAQTTEERLQLKVQQDAQLRDMLERGAV